VISDLEFCTDVTYAVPSSPEFKTDDTRLSKLYDDKAREYYENFEKSLAQVACDTTSTAQYSLARNCDDCRRDYKTWLCAVLIPRCEDWNATDDWLQPRRINAQFADGSTPSPDMITGLNNTFRERFAVNKSRNAFIDEEIQPGPYKELLPCEDLCFDIVRSCPAVLGFACPGQPATKSTYGSIKDPSMRNLTCNFPGAVVNLSPLRGSATTLPSLRLEFMSTLVLAVAAWNML
jgi:calcium channel MID1